MARLAMRWMTVAVCAAWLGIAEPALAAGRRRGDRLRAHAAAPQLHRRRGFLPAAGRRRLDARARQHGARRGRRALHRRSREPRAPGRGARLRARGREHAARRHEPRARFPPAARHERNRLARSAQPEGGPDLRARHAERGLHGRADGLLPRRGRRRDHDVREPARRARHAHAGHGRIRRHRRERAGGGDGRRRATDRELRGRPSSMPGTAGTTRAPTNRSMR